MLAESKILFFFGALGAFNGILIALYFLFFAKPFHISNRFLGAFLLCVSIRALKSAFFHFSMDKYQLPIVFLMISIAAFFFIGPFLIFYLQSTIRDQQNHIRQWKYHGYGLLIILIILEVLFYFPERRNMVVDIIYLAWMVYTILAGILIAPYLKKSLSKESSLLTFEIWTICLFFSNLIILIFFTIGHYTTYIIGSITFSIISYLFVIVLAFNKNRKAILFAANNNRNSHLIDQKQIDNLSNKLNAVMITESLYKNPHLRLADVAKKLDISVHQLSELLNNHIGKNFSNFVNEFRVDHAKSLIKSNHNYTLEAIGYESGFNSKSTFYSAFKKVVGTSPSHFSP